MFNKLKNWLENSYLAKFLRKHKTLLNRSEIYVSLVTVFIKVCISCIFFFIWGEESAINFLSQVGLLYLIVFSIYLINSQKFEFVVDKIITKLFKYNFFLKFFASPFLFSFIVLYTRYKSEKDIKEEFRNKFRLIYYSFFMLYGGFFPSFFFIFCPRFMFLAYIFFFVNLCKFIVKGINVDTSYLVLNFEYVRNLLDSKELADKEIFLTSKFLDLPERIRYVYNSVYDGVRRGNTDGLSLLFLLIILFKKYSSDTLSLLINENFTNKFLVSTENVVKKNTSLKTDHVFINFQTITAQDYLLATGGLVGVFQSVGRGVATGLGTAAVAVATWMQLQREDSKRREGERKKDSEEIRKTSQEEREKFITTSQEEREKFITIRQEEREKDITEIKKVLDADYNRKQEQYTQHTQELIKLKNQNSVISNRPTQNQVDEIMKENNKVANEFRDAMQKHSSVIEEEYIFIQIYKLIVNVVKSFFGF